MTPRERIQKEVLRVLNIVKHPDGPAATPDIKIGSGGLGISKGLLVNLHWTWTRIARSVGGPDKRVFRGELDALGKKKVKALIDLIEKKSKGGGK